jgi:hypothetical protein
MKEDLKRIIWDCIIGDDSIGLYFKHLTNVKKEDIMEIRILTDKEKEMVLEDIKKIEEESQTPLIEFKKLGFIDKSELSFIDDNYQVMYVAAFTIPGNDIRLKQQFKQSISNYEKRSGFILYSLRIHHPDDYDDEIVKMKIGEELLKRVDENPEKVKEFLNFYIIKSLRKFFTGSL